MNELRENTLLLYEGLRNLTTFRISCEIFDIKETTKSKVLMKLLGRYAGKST